MKKLSLVTIFILVAFVFASCKKKKEEDTEPVSEIIRKVWAAKTVMHNNAIVYTEGGISNSVEGYANFRLDLSNTASVTLREFTNDSFTGQWEVLNDRKLVLRGLVPEPTGTNGIIEYTIITTSETELTLTRTTNSVKTGGSNVKYILVMQ